MYIIIYEMDRQSGFNCGGCTGMILMDGMGKEAGGVQDGEHMYTCGGSMSIL